jgi:hypothetical protein
LVFVEMGKGKEGHRERKKVRRFGSLKMSK